MFHLTLEARQPMPVDIGVTAEFRGPVDRNKSEQRTFTNSISTVGHLGDPLNLCYIAGAVPGNAPLGVYQLVRFSAASLEQAIGEGVEIPLEFEYYLSVEGKKKPPS
jgi:hypothetical protein